MIKLDSGNVLLKPSHRKQLMTWLRRVQKLGQRLGDFVLTITIKRVGRFYEARATIEDRSGQTFHCRARRHDWRDTMRELARRLTQHLHELNLHHTTPAS